MYARLIGEETAERAEGPLLFLRRSVDVGLNEAVEVESADGRVRLGRIAALDEEVGHGGDARRYRGARPPGDPGPLCR